MTARDSIKKILQFLHSIELPKEALHVLETKLSSLEEHLVSRETENARLREEIEKLKIQVKCLQPQTEEISQDTIRVLRLLFDRAGGASADDISTMLQWKPDVVDYHLDVLLKKRFICESSLGMRTPFGASVQRFGLTTLGRRYIIQYVAV
jgi:predicted nuclease with TOPRIM domain